MAKQPEAPQRKFAFCYARASTGRQTDSIAVQKERCLQYFDYRLKPDGFTFSCTYEDLAVSGKKELRTREGGLALCNALQPGDAVIVFKIDRAFRNARDALNVVHLWQDQGIHLHILDWNVDTRTPMGKFMLTILSGFAEWEHHRISERQIESQRWRRENGKVSNKAPWGFKNVGRTPNMRQVPDLEQREFGKWVVRWKLAGYTFDQLYFHLLRARKFRKDGREYGIQSIQLAYKRMVQIMHKEPGGTALLERWRVWGLDHYHKRNGIIPEDLPAQ
jgi:DNA invertase Pin-like site-specific DNA recombinase